MKKIKMLVLLAAIMAVVAFAGCNSGTNVDGNGNKGAESGSSSDSSKQKAADFKLTDINGDQVQLSDLKGKVVVINFFATWCSPCMREMPGFVKTAEEYSDNKELQFLFIDLGEDKATVMDFLSKAGYKNIVPLLDLSGEVADLYGVTGIPATFIIDRDGYIEQAHEGLMEESTLKQYIESAI